MRNATNTIFLTFYLLLDQYETCENLLNYMDFIPINFVESTLFNRFPYDFLIPILMLKNNVLLAFL